MAARTNTDDRIAALEAQLATLVDALTAAQATTKPRETSEASAHWVARDLACPKVKTCGHAPFRSEKGRAWHLANVKH